MKKVAVSLVIAFLLFVQGAITFGEESGIVAKVEDTVITEQDVQDVIQSYNYFGKKPSRKFIIDNFIAEILLYKEALARGIQERPQVKDKIEKSTRKIMTGAFIEEAVKSKVTVTEQEMKNYYEKNKDDMFTDPRMVSFYSARVAKLDKKGKDVTDEARNTAQCILDTWRERDVFVEDIDKVCLKNPDIIIDKARPEFVKKGNWGGEKLDAAIFSLNAGEVSDIIDEEKNFSVVKIIFVQPENIHDYDEVSGGIRRRITDEKTVEELKKIIGVLKNKYKIEIFDESFKTE
jgi:hypothetical protein